MKILVTGAAGFIGSHLCKKLLDLDHDVFGIDNLNNYYDVSFKLLRLDRLNSSRFSFNEIDISDNEKLLPYISNIKPNLIINLAAQAGVRYSLENPKAYFDSNIVGFGNILESARINNVKKIIYASSSSVYGNSKEIPFCETLKGLSPISLYAASKFSNELIAKSYSYNFGISLIGLRFFTVYGEYGRPDMAYYSFTEKIKNDEQITIYNKGKMSRDMTFIDDIIDGINRSIIYINDNENIDNEIFNLGNNNPVSVWDLVNYISNFLNKDVNYTYMDLNTEVDITYANIEKAKEYLGWIPKTTFEDGMNKFLSWHSRKKQ
ncbi:MAG: hypothetical protein CMD79_04080 [Gammaproteobacteria bacterium]|nr:hypothetical protein [Gammaproteobacteria bacterium]|tara:strand:+ start:32682 stop:33641 length:960 start_codon:yes stop_codon:yes gene_type:complete